MTAVMTGSDWGQLLTGVAAMAALGMSQLNGRRIRRHTRELHRLRARLQAIYRALADSSSSARAEVLGFLDAEDIDATEAIIRAKREMR